MFSFLKKLRNTTPAPDFRQLLKNGAQLIDVRTEAEYRIGHIRNSINIPLNNISNASKKLKKDRPVITCCASGMRSAQACKTLQSLGFSEVYNGKGWAELNSKISES